MVLTANDDLSAGPVHAATGTEWFGAYDFFDVLFDQADVTAIGIDLAQYDDPDVSQDDDFGFSFRWFTDVATFHPLTDDAVPTFAQLDPANWEVIGPLFYGNIGANQDSFDMRASSITITEVPPVPEPSCCVLLIAATIIPVSLRRWRRDDSR